jgi:hypothetical protein
MGQSDPDSLVNGNTASVDVPLPETWRVRISEDLLQSLL